MSRSRSLARSESSLSLSLPAGGLSLAGPAEAQAGKPVLSLSHGEALRSLFTASCHYDLPEHRRTVPRCVPVTVTQAQPEGPSRKRRPGRSEYRHRDAGGGGHGRTVAAGPQPPRPPPPGPGRVTGTITPGCGPGGPAAAQSLERSSSSSLTCNEGAATPDSDIGFLPDIGSPNDHLES
jgi:hypothetical protein